MKMLEIKSIPAQNFFNCAYQHTRQSRGKKYGSKLGNKKEMIQTEMQREKEYKKIEHPRTVEPHGMS